MGLALALQKGLEIKVPSSVLRSFSLENFSQKLLLLGGPSRQAESLWSSLAPWEGMQRGTGWRHVCGWVRVAWEERLRAPLLPRLLPPPARFHWASLVSSSLLLACAALGMVGGTGALGAASCSGKCSASSNSTATHASLS